MAKFQITYRHYLKTLLIVHLGMMMAQLIFIAIIFVLVNEESSIIDLYTQNILLIVVPIAIILIISMGKYFYQLQLKKITSEKELASKFKSYQIIQIIQFAFAEIAALTCFLASFLSQNLVFVYGSIGILLYFLTLRPTKIKLEKELQFDFNEQNNLANPDFVLYEVERSELN